MRTIRDLLLIISLSITTFAINTTDHSDGGELTDLNVLMSDTPETSNHHAGDYLSEATADLAYSTNVGNNSFNYEPKTEEYEPVAAGAGLLVNAKFNRYRREKALQDRADRSAKCTEKGLLRPENRHQDPRDFLWNPLSPNTYTAIWDYATGKHNPRRDQISQSYVNALNDGWYPSIGHREPLNCEKEEMQTPEWMKIIP